jgi:tRNA 2-thiocytidine biosynthesis protein TtcA
MLAEWESNFPGRTASIFSALRNVETAQLADPRHFDFAGLDLKQRLTDELTCDTALA